MGRLFSYDAPVSRFLNRLGDLMILSLLWIGLSLPVVTMGAATAALYSAAARLHRGNSHGGRTFLISFRALLRPATLFWVPMLLWGGLLLVNLWVIPALEEPAKGMCLGLTLVLCLLWLILVSYGLPMLAVRQASFGALFRDALVLAVSHPLHTAAVLLSNLFPLLFLLLAPVWFFRLLVLWPVLGIGGIAYCNTLHLSKLLSFPSGRDLEA